VEKLAYLSSSSDFDSSSRCNFKTLGEIGSSWAESTSEFAGAKGLLSPGCGLGDFLLPSACKFPESSRIGGNWGVDLLAKRCPDDRRSFGEGDCKSSLECPIFLKKLAIDFPIPLLCGTFPFSYTILTFISVKMHNPFLKVQSVNQSISKSIKFIQLQKSKIINESEVIWNPSSSS